MHRVSPNRGWIDLIVAEPITQGWKLFIQGSGPTMFYHVFGFVAVLHQSRLTSQQIVAEFGTNSKKNNEIVWEPNLCHPTRTNNLQHRRARHRCAGAYLSRFFWEPIFPFSPGRIMGIVKFSQFLGSVGHYRVGNIWGCFTHSWTKEATAGRN